MRTRQGLILMRHRRGQIVVRCFLLSLYFPYAVFCQQDEGAAQGQEPLNVEEAPAAGSQPKQYTLASPDVKRADRGCATSTYESVDCGCCTAATTHFAALEKYTQGASLGCRQYIDLFAHVPDECGGANGPVPEAAKVAVLQALKGQRAQGATTNTSPLAWNPPPEVTLRDALDNHVVDLISLGPAAGSPNRYLWPMLRCDDGELICVCPDEISDARDDRDLAAETATAQPPGPTAVDAEGTVPSPPAPSAATPPGEEVCTEEEMRCVPYTREQQENPFSNFRLHELPVYEAYAIRYHDAALWTSPVTYLPKNDFLAQQQAALPHCRGEQEAVPAEQVQTAADDGAATTIASSALDLEESDSESPAPAAAATASAEPSQEEGATSTSASPSRPRGTPPRTGLGFFRCKHISVENCEKHYIRFPMRRAEDVEKNGFWRCVRRRKKKKECAAQVFLRSVVKQRQREAQYASMRSAFNPAMIMLRR